MPVVSAVGHEQDTPLCDLAADVRASTPTAAARIVVPDLGDLLDSLERQRVTLQRGTRSIIVRRQEALDRDVERLRRSSRLLFERRRAALEQAAGRLRTLSPQATLSRGYAVVRAGGVVVRSAADLAVADRVEVNLSQGGFDARVEEVRS